MELKSYNRRIGHESLKGSKWENLLHFWDTSKTAQFLVFSPEIEAKKLLALDRKIPDLFLMGTDVLVVSACLARSPRPRTSLSAALVDDRILSKRELQDLAKLPPIDVLRAELSSILQTPARRTSSLLGRSQQQLSQNLEQYLKDRTGSSDENDKDD